MTIDEPKISHVPALRALFADSFGESEEFLDLFFDTAFTPSRSRIATEDGRLLASLFWFDCELRGSKIAYIYAISTAKEYRGKGICRALMKSTHSHLKSLGYTAAILVPAEPSLFDFYARLGYKAASGLSETVAAASDTGAFLREVSREEYAALRQGLLPDGAVVAGDELIKMLSATAKLYMGEGFILAARVMGNRLFGIELLGDTSRAPDILAALGVQAGIFRTAGNAFPFSAYLPLSDIAPAPPSYFGIALDK